MESKNISAKDLSVEVKSAAALSFSDYRITSKNIKDANLQFFSLSSVEFESGQSEIYQPKKGYIGSYCASGNAIVAVVDNGLGFANSCILPNEDKTVKALEKIGFAPAFMPVPLAAPGCGTLAKEADRKAWKESVKKLEKRRDTLRDLSSRWPNCKPLRAPINSWHSAVERYK